MLKDELLKNKQILVVDDEPDLREILTDELSFAGAEVVGANNGSEGFALALQTKLDVIVSDIRMPGGDGVSLARKIRHDLGTKIVIALVSGYSDVGFDEAYDLGADVYISKPFNLTAVRESIERQLLPLQRRCAEKNTSSVKKIKLQSTKIEEALSSGEVSLGRGGAFLAVLDHSLRLGDLVEFDLGLNFQGQAVVRWVRAEAGGNPVGVGVDFIWLSQTTYNLVSQWINQHLPIAYIPRK